MNKASFTILAAALGLAITETAAAAEGKASGTSQGGEKHPIDIQYDKCMEDDTMPTTRSMNECSIEAAEAWDSELNKNYKTLMADDTLAQEKLRLSQRKWIEYRDLEFKFLANLYAKDPASLRCLRTHFVRDRALMLKSSYETLRPQD